MYIYYSFSTHYTIYRYNNMHECCRHVYIHIIYTDGPAILLLAVYMLMFLVFISPSRPTGKLALLTRPVPYSRGCCLINILPRSYFTPCIHTAIIK